MQLPMVKNYANTAQTRNASILIREDWLDMTGGDISGFVVLICHQTWTGREWLSIVQKDECFTLPEAITTAENAAKQIGFIAI